VEVGLIFRADGLFCLPLSVEAVYATREGRTVAVTRIDSGMGWIVSIRADFSCFRAKVVRVQDFYFVDSADCAARFAGERIPRKPAKRQIRAAPD